MIICACLRRFKNKKEWKRHHDGMVDIFVRNILKYGSCTYYSKPKK